MSKKTILLGLISVVTSSYLYASNNIISYNFNYTSYSDKIKEKNSYDLGLLYKINTDNKINFEIDGKIKRLSFEKNDNNSTVNYNDNPYYQADLSLAAIFENDYIKARVGNHIILHYQKNDIGTHHNNIYFAGIELRNNINKYNNENLYYDDYYYNDDDVKENDLIGLGVNLYYSDYDTFYSKQISPYIYTKNFIKNINVKFIYNNIKLSKQLNYLSKKNYKNYSYLAEYNFEDFSLGAILSIGKNAYKVFNEGLSVNNLGLEYKNSYSIFMKINFSEKTKLQINFTHSNFTEKNNNASSNSISMNLSF